jgi:hypothetical protein
MEAIMTAPTDAFRVAVPEALCDILAERITDLPGPDLDHGLLRDSVAKEYDAVRAESPEAQGLVQRLRSLLNNEHGDGFAVLEAEPLLDRFGVEEGQMAVTIILSWIATPLRAFDKWPLWKPLGTNLTIDPMRATGSGYNPLHIDVVNATLPPDYSALLCVRPDPRGRGHSLVSQLRRAVERLSDEERELLAESVYSDGAFYDLTGVGENYNPFPVLDGRPAAEGFVRFTAKMLPEMDVTDPHTSAVRALERELIAEQKEFLLDRGDLIIVNQHLCVHGRQPLGLGQDELPEVERRLLKQIFLRSTRAGA